MNKKLKITIIILSLILVILIILNFIKKENNKSNTEINSEINKVNFTEPINNLIEAEGINITKEINISWKDNDTEIKHNYIYNYQQDLNNMYLSGTFQKNQGELIPIYLVTDDDKKYYYQDKDWMRKDDKAISYKKKQLFIDDDKTIINLLKEIKKIDKKEDNALC